MKPRQITDLPGYAVRDRQRAIAAPPIITSPNTADVSSNDTVVQLSANKPVIWSIVGGLDQSTFTINGVSMLISIPDISVPSDSDHDGVYNVILRATDSAGNHADQSFNAKVPAPN